MCYVWVSELNINMPSALQWLNKAPPSFIHSSASLFSLKLDPSHHSHFGLLNIKHHMRIFPRINFAWYITVKHTLMHTRRADSILRGMRTSCDHPLCLMTIPVEKYRNTVYHWISKHICMVASFQCMLVKWSVWVTPVLRKNSYLSFSPTWMCIMYYILYIHIFSLLKSTCHLCVCILSTCTCKQIFPWTAFQRDKSPKIWKRLLYFLRSCLFWYLCTRVFSLKDVQN